MYSMFAAMQIEPDDPVDEKECMSFCAPVFLPTLENAVVSFQDVNNESAHDEEAIQLKETIIKGFPKVRDELSESLRYYY